MRCIFIGLLIASSLVSGTASASTAKLRAADAYSLADLDAPAALLKHFKLYVDAAKAEPSYEAAWKAAMWAYYVWQKATPKPQREDVARLALRFGKQATELNPQGAEGWFWFGAAVGIVGLSRGPLDSLHLVPDCEKAFKKSQALDPEYYEGAAERNLARLYMMVPGTPISIGNDLKAKAMLDASLVKYPNFPLTYIYLADWHWKKGEFDKALGILNRLDGLPMKNEGQAFFLPWVKRQLNKVRPRIEAHEPRGLLDPTLE